MEEKKQFEDIIGQPISEGSYVVTCQSNSLYVCRVGKITTKMLRVYPIKWKKSSGILKYPQDLIVLSGPDALAYILTHENAQ